MHSDLAQDTMTLASNRHMLHVSCRGWRSAVMAVFSYRHVVHVSCRGWWSGIFLPNVSVHAPAVHAAHVMQLVDRAGRTGRTHADPFCDNSRSSVYSVSQQPLAERHGGGQLLTCGACGLQGMVVWRQSAKWRTCSWRSPCGMRRRWIDPRPSTPHTIGPCPRVWNAARQTASCPLCWATTGSIVQALCLKALIVLQANGQQIVLVSQFGRRRQIVRHHFLVFFCCLRRCVSWAQGRGDRASVLCHNLLRSGSSFSKATIIALNAATSMYPKCRHRFKLVHAYFDCYLRMRPHHCIWPTQHARMMRVSACCTAVMLVLKGLLAIGAAVPFLSANTYKHGLFAFRFQENLF